MRLAISNLAWPPAQDEVVFDRLARLGGSGVEVAPTRLAAWDALPTSLLTGYRTRVEAAGLVVSSLQAVLFGRPELRLLGEGAAFDGMLEHMRHVADIGATLGAGVLVFGAPRNRLRADMEPGRAWARARERLRLLGEITFAAGVLIGIEPVPAVYGGDFLASWSDVLRMVQDVDHPGVVREAVGVVDILIARETAEHRLAQQAGQQMARVPAATAFRQCRTREIGQPERVIQFAIGKKTSVRGDATAMEFQLQAAVEIHPEGPVIRFTCWVFHPRASNPTITC